MKNENVEEQMGNLNRDRSSKSKQNQRMFLMALDMATKRINELEDVSIGSFKTEIQSEKK